MKKMYQLSVENYNIDFSGYKYNISFFGNPAEKESLEILCELIKVFTNKLKIFSNEKDFERSVQEIKNNKLLDENQLQIYLKSRKPCPENDTDLARTYNASKINLSFSSKARINRLIYSKILAAGGFLITNENKNLKKHFEISKHLETFKNIEDLIDKIQFYLLNLNIAQKIAQLGKFQVIKNYTFSVKTKL